jgi:chaperonin GroEL
MSIAIKSKAEVAFVGTIASNNDSEMGELLAETIAKVGKDGVITIDEGKSLKIEVEIVEGMQIDRGYISPYFVNSPSTMECVLEDPYVLVHEKKISNIKETVPLLEAVVNTGRPLLIIAEDVDGEALAALVVNKMRGVFQICAIKAPGYGDRRKAMIEDIAILTGATPQFADVDIKLESVQLTHLGRAKKVIATKDGTTIIEGAGKTADIKARINQIRDEMSVATNAYDRERLDERIAKLSGGVAKVNVGAATKSEIVDKRIRVENALHAMRAALEEGILPGGGVALLRASAAARADGLTQDQEIGYDIVIRACRAPLTTIASNAGQDGGVVCQRVLEGKGNAGYNAATDTYEDLVKAGVTDPTKVTRLALQNAASVATLLLTSEALIAERPRAFSRSMVTHIEEDAGDEATLYSNRRSRCEESQHAPSNNRNEDTPSIGVPLPKQRVVNMWLDEDTPTFRLGSESRVWADIGEPRDEFASGQRQAFAEPDWGDATHLELSLVLYGTGVRVRPARQKGSLPRNGSMCPVWFHVNPTTSGQLKLTLAIFIDGEETLLQKCELSIEVDEKTSLAESRL